MSRQNDLDRVCEYRKLPPLKIGAECEVDGKKGIIVGGNCSANLNVLFDGENHYNSCHPGYRMRIFNRTGGLCYESEDLYAETPSINGRVYAVRWRRLLGRRHSK